MFSDSSQFQNLIPSHVTLQTADKKTHRISSEGAVTLQAVQRNGIGKRIHIGRTLHTPGMHNLLSCCGVLDSGGVVHLETGNSYIKLRDDTVFPVHKRGKLFYLDYITPATKHSVPARHAGPRITQVTKTYGFSPRGGPYGACGYLGVLKKVAAVGFFQSDASFRKRAVTCREGWRGAAEVA